MTATSWRLRPGDLRFLVETLIPERTDPDHLVDLIEGDESLLAGMLEDDRVFQRMMSNEEAFLSVSPQLFFKVLLLRARRDLGREQYTIERRQQQRVALFDASQAAELLGQGDVCEYLAAMLASFTRIHSVTIPFRVRRGIWRRLRINDLDVESLIAYANILEEQQRFALYRRIADACLFLAGIFPEHIETRRSFPLGAQPRARRGGSVIRDLEDYESCGQAFYRLAAGHSDAGRYGLGQVLATLSAKFILAEKPLGFLADRYLSLHKHKIFAGPGSSG